MKFDPYTIVMDNRVLFVSELVAIHKIEAVLNEEELWKI